EQDHDQAIDWLTRSARQRNTRAMPSGDRVVRPPPRRPGPDRRVRMESPGGGGGSDPGLALDPQGDRALLQQGSDQTGEEGYVRSEEGVGEPAEVNPRREPPHATRVRAFLPIIPATRCASR